MRLKLEPFTDGFLRGLKPQMSVCEVELLATVFAGRKPSRFASDDEKDPAKAQHYFRLDGSHLNVLLPLWIMNGKTSTRADRFRVACTDDHSFIVDAREATLYDPTTEALYGCGDYKPFRLTADWKDESQFRYRPELERRALKVFCLSERIEHLPDVYGRFAAFVRRWQLKVPGFRADLTIAPPPETSCETPFEVLQDLIRTELWLRTSAV